MTCVGVGVGVWGGCWPGARVAAAGLAQRLPLAHSALCLCSTRLPPAVQAKGVEFVLPTDVIVADKFAPDAATQTVDASAIPDGWMVSPPPASAPLVAASRTVPE